MTMRGKPLHNTRTGFPSFPPQHAQRCAPEAHPRSAAPVKEDMRSAASPPESTAEPPGPPPPSPAPAPAPADGPPRSAAPVKEDMRSAAPPPESTADPPGPAPSSDAAAAAAAECAARARGTEESVAARLAQDAAPLGQSASMTALAPLTIPVFRMLWLTWVTANTCMWMNDVAAAWLMTTLTSSPILV